MKTTSYPTHFLSLALAATLTLTLALTVSACGSGEPADLDMTEADFSCILDWPKVDRFRILNMLGDQAEAEEVARSAEGGTYPVGTVIQLLPNEAMVKRREGFSASTGDWEFFLLDVTPEGTSIRTRGTTDVINDFGGNCLDCHSQAEPRFDFVCADGHGCEPLPVTAEELEQFQRSDPRCQ